MTRKLLPLIAALGGLAGAGMPLPAEAQSIVERIRARGHVQCGASTGVPGLSRADENGVWRGFDSDICRAFAVALLGDRERIRFTPLVTAARLPALQTGEIDVLSRTTTWTYSRDAAVRFVATTLYDGEAIIHRTALNIRDVRDFNGMTFCVTGGGNLGEKSLTELEQKYRISVRRVTFENPQQTRDTYLAGRCDAYITDGTAAAGVRATLARNPNEHAIFVVPGEPPEPLGVAIPRGDDRWFDIVRWSIFAMIWAEENGITSGNVEEKARTADDKTRRILGALPGIGRPLGLDDRWVFNVIRQIGNYGEVFERNLGSGSPMGLPRGLNALWSQSGLMISPTWD
jgi:general L-amino acid transport system substrate-binding protein